MTRDHLNSLYLGTEADVSIPAHSARGPCAAIPPSHRLRHVSAARSLDLTGCAREFTSTFPARIIRYQLTVIFEYFLGELASPLS